jgi:UDP-N-acetylglucosamine 2-epimerase (non-hydrolysing)
MKIAIVLGTRPEIIKLAPIINKLNKKNSQIIFTGQHYDYDMSLRFIEQLGLRKPDYSLKISHSDPPIQIGEIITKLPKIFKKIKPDTVIVQGDTNTVLAAALSSLKLEIPVSHVEAGLRSFDWRMPEEHNRIATDHLSEYLFAPTKNSKVNLTSENVQGRIFVTGNTIIDAINTFVVMASKKSKLSVDIDDYILMTLHRAENVDHKKTIVSIISAILESKRDIIFPVHPRTLKRLKEFNLYEKLLKSENVLLLDSVGYFEMLELMKKCSFIISDSGGIQEEATSPNLRKKVLIIRKTTDRPEAVEEGFAELVGVSHSRILSAIKRNTNLPKVPSKKSPYGQGKASQTIIKLINKHL